MDTNADIKTELNNSPQLFICACHSTEHQMVFLPWQDEFNKEVFVHIHLNKRPFWDRLKYGIKYIFGYNCRFGAFDEFIFDKDNVQNLKKIINFIENDEKN